MYFDFYELDNFMKEVTEFKTKYTEVAGGMTDEEIMDFLCKYQMMKTLDDLSGTLTTLTNTSGEGIPVKIKGS